MVRLEMTNAEGKVLAETLESSLRRLGDEISHTDSHDYRESLKNRQAILAKLSDKLH